MDDDEERRLLIALEQASTPDARLVALQSLDAFVERVDHITHFDELANALRLQTKQANPLVSSKAFSILPSFLETLTNTGGGRTNGGGVGTHTAQSTHHVRFALNTLMPLVVERLNDHRERSRDTAKAAIVHLARAAHAITPSSQASHLVGSAVRGRNGAEETPFGLFERLLVEAGLRSKVTKVREQSILLLPTLRTSIARLPLRPFLSVLVEHLSDADAIVREASRSTIVALFSSASSTAKAELKKEVESKGVRRQTADYIFTHVFGADDETEGNAVQAISASAASSQLSVPSSSIVVGGGSSINRSSTKSPGVTSDESGSRSASRMGSSFISEVAAATARPVYIASAGDTERTFAAMLPHFTGKETEQNWQPREQAIIKIRGMLRTSTHESFPSAFTAGVQKMAEGILKAAASLRTTLSIQGITLVSELAQQLADDLDSLAETFLVALIRMSGFTKKIVANASQAAVGDILRNVSYKHKYLDTIAQFLPDKNPTVRMAMCKHIATILATHGKHRKHALESHGGLDTITKFCKKALADANKDVRALAREVFYRVEEIWPSVGSSIYDSLDANLQRQVESNRSTRLTDSTPTPQRPVESVPAPARAISPRKPGTPGGPSSALLAAKRAAAAAMARERREREEAEARAQAAEDARATEERAEEEEEDEELMNTQEVQEAEMEEQRRLSPSPPARYHRSSSRLSSHSPPSPVASSFRSPPRWQAPSATSPSSIPLPTSSPSGGLSKRSSGLLPAARSRTTSTSSATSNRSSVGRFGGVASTVDRYGSIAQRFDQSPSQAVVAGREARKSAATSSSTLSAASANDEEDRSLDETSFDNSVHVSPTSLIKSVAPLSIRKTSASPNQNTSADSPSVRSRLPRPISMLPTPTSSSSSVQTPLKSRHSHSSSVGVIDQAADTSNVTPTRDTSRTLMTSARSPLLHQQESAQERRSHLEHAQEDVPADASRATKWFLGKANRLDNAQLPAEEHDRANLSPVKRRPESEEYIAQLLNRRANLRTFKGLVALSKEFRLPKRPERQSASDDERDGHVAGALGLMTNAEEEFDVAVAMWQEARLFERLFDALCKYLDVVESDVSRDLQTAAMVLLHRLVENQFGLFAVQGRERELVDLLFSLIKLNSSSGSSNAGVKSACQAIADRWSDQTDMIVGISTLRAAALPLLNGTSSSDREQTNEGHADVIVMTLALRTLARLFARLPSEVVEEQMERCKAVVKFGLHHHQIELRQQAVAVLVAANSSLQDPQSLFSILQPIEKAQEDLLVYYMNKQ